MSISNIQLTYDDIMSITAKHKKSCDCKLCAIKYSKKFSHQDIEQKIIDEVFDVDKKQISALIMMRNNHFNIPYFNITLSIMELPRTINEFGIYQQYYKGKYRVWLVGKYTKQQWEKQQDQSILKNLDIKENGKVLPLSRYKNEYALPGEDNFEYKTQKASFNRLTLYPQEVATFKITRRMDKTDLLSSKKSLEKGLRIREYLSCVLRFQGDYKET